MRIYETTFILSPQADDAAFDRQVKSVAELITRHDGRILSEERMGIRRLAYPIKKLTQGYYTRIIFEGNNDILREVERLYRLEEPYIRNLTVKYEGRLEDISDEFVKEAVKERAGSEEDRHHAKVSSESESKDDVKDSDEFATEKGEGDSDDSSDSEASDEEHANDNP